MSLVAVHVLRVLEGERMCEAAEELAIKVAGGHLMEDCCRSSVFVFRLCAPSESVVAVQRSSKARGTLFAAKGQFKGRDLVRSFLGGLRSQCSDPF